MAARPPQKRSSRDTSKRGSTSRGTALGVELAASIVGFTLVGLWIDHTYDTGPWGTLICVVLGTVGGFYNFLRDALRILRPPPLRTSDDSPPESHPTRKSPADEAPSPAPSDREPDH